MGIDPPPLRGGGGFRSMVISPISKRRGNEHGTQTAAGGSVDLRPPACVQAGMAPPGDQGMTIRISKHTEECDDCHGPIEPGEPFSGPTRLGHETQPTRCWECACNVSVQHEVQEQPAAPDPGKLF